MDDTVSVSRSLPAVFAVLADPARLTWWVRDVSGVERNGPGGANLEEEFRLKLADGPAVGEVIGFEPPWYVAFRLSTTDTSHVLRIRCSAAAGATRVEIHQADATAIPLDLRGLTRTLTHSDPTR